MKLLSYKRHDKHVIFKHPIIAYALSVGGFIAGGFGRQFLNDQSGIKDYLTCRLAYDRRGDVDIFFPSSQTYEQVVEFARLYRDNYNHNISHGPPGKVYIGDSPTKFCTNIEIPQEEVFRTPPSTEYWCQGTCVKIQLVNVFHGKPEDVLETFDIENCKVAITEDRVIYSPEFVNLEKLKTLKVTKPASPLLPHRIAKYTSHRGMGKIHTSSSSHMREWILNWRLCVSSDHPLSHLSNGNAEWGKEHLVKLLRYENLVTTDQLSLLFGKLNYRKQFGSGYHTYWKEVDPVREEIKHRLV